MDLKKTPTCRRRVGMTMVFALATISVSLAGSGVAPLVSESAAAAAPVPFGASAASSSKQAFAPQAGLHDDLHPASHPAGGSESPFRQ